MHTFDVYNFAPARDLSLGENTPFSKFLSYEYRQLPVT